MRLFQCACIQAFQIISKFMFGIFLPHRSRIKATMSRSAFLVQNPPLLFGLKNSSAISSGFAKEQLQEATSTRKMIPFPK